MSFDPNDPVFLAAVAQAVAVAMANQQATTPVPSDPALPGAASKPAVPANSVLSTTECPKISDITLLQATQWDAGSKQPYKRRYKLCLEVWTEPEEKNIKLSDWQWKRYVLLYNWKDIRNLAYKGLKRGTISQAYYDWIDAVTEKSSQHSHWFGMIGDKRQGTHYYDHQFVRVRINADDKIEDMALLHTDDVLSIEHWSDKDCKGQRLKGNFTSQARLDLCDYGMGWATEAKRY